MSGCENFPIPHNAALSNETVASKRNDDGVAWARASEVASNDGTVRDDRLPSENDVLRTSNDSASRDFVSRVLAGSLHLTVKNGRRRVCFLRTVSMNSGFE